MSNNLPPSIFVIGAPKCGTTALVNFLNQSEFIICPEPKEPLFFFADSKRRKIANRNAYLSIFGESDADNSRNILKVDASVFYLYSKIALDAISSIRSSKVIVMTRDPIDFLKSWHNQLLFNGLQPYKEFADAWRNGLMLSNEYKESKLSSLEEFDSWWLLYDELAQHLKYLNKWQNALPRGHLLHLNQQQLLEQPAETVKLIEAFVERPIDRYIEDYAILINSKRESVHPALLRIRLVLKRITTLWLYKSFKNFLGIGTLGFMKFLASVDSQPTKDSIYIPADIQKQILQSSAYHEC